MDYEGRQEWETKGEFCVFSPMWTLDLNIMYYCIHIHIQTHTYMNDKKAEGLFEGSRRLEETG